MTTQTIRKRQRRSVILTYWIHVKKTSNTYFHVSILQQQWAKLFHDHFGICQLPPSHIYTRHLTQMMNTGYLLGVVTPKCNIIFHLLEFNLFHLVSGNIAPLQTFCCQLPVHHQSECLLCPQYSSYVIMQRQLYQLRIGGVTTFHYRYSHAATKKKIFP